MTNTKSIYDDITVSELKAFMHLFVVPLGLLALTMNIIASMLWVVFSSVIYLTAKRNTESSKSFFTMLKVFSSFILIVILAMMLMVIA